MNSVIRGAGYILVHTPDMVLYNGTTQTTERIVNPDGEYLRELPSHIRSFDQALAYWPNQVYIGNKTPEELSAVPQPWYDKSCDVNSRYGSFGQIMPEEEFYLLMKASDVFDLVFLTKEFTENTLPAFKANPLITEEIVSRVGEGIEKAEVVRLIEEEHSEGLYIHGEPVGCVKRAHDIDQNLSAHVIHENLVSKASCVLSVLSALQVTGTDPGSVEYIIDCSEEACGDMNQRGGGNFAKSVAEIAGLMNTTGSDVRGFCAAPAHAIIEAASLGSAGTYETGCVCAGGCTAKLGMNAKDHVKKDLPAYEDMIGGFSVIISADDGISPVINLKAVGRHTVGTGTAPQAVITSLVADPLQRNGLKITDVDKFAGELHNSDILKPAGAGDPANQNYKLIAALAVKLGDLDRKEIPAFIADHGLTGWAPTQGHIPSGVPYLGFLREDILAGRVQRAMIIGKGSLFLGRMTNLFDGISFLVEKNTGETQAEGLSEEAVRKYIAEAMRAFAEGLLKPQA